MTNIWKYYDKLSTVNKPLKCQYPRMWPSWDNQKRNQQLPFQIKPNKNNHTRQKVAMKQKGNVSACQSIVMSTMSRPQTFWVSSWTSRSQFCTVVIKKWNSHNNYLDWRKPKIILIWSSLVIRNNIDNKFSYCNGQTRNHEWVINYVA